MDEYQKDAVKIVRDYLKHGYKISIEQAEDIWSAYSEELCASWIIMGDDTNGLFEMTERHANDLKLI